MLYRALISAVLMMFAGADAAARSRIGSSSASILRIEQALEFFKLDVGRYPGTEEGLSSLVTCPRSMNCSRYNPTGYMKPEGLLDPWGEPYRYKYPGARSKEPFDLWSLGPDRISGSEDDVGNWQSVDLRSRGTPGLGSLLLGAAVASALGAAVALPVYLWGIVTALRGTRTWRAALLGEPLAFVLYLIGVSIWVFLFVSQSSID